MQYTIEKSGTINLGKQGEHRARELVLPEVTAWETEYGSGEAEIIFLPPGEKTPVSITPVRTEDGAWLWTVTATETARPGYGKCELRYAAGGAVVKSVTYQTYAAESLGESEPVPETDPDDVRQRGATGMPPLADEESGTSYALMVESGKLMIQEVGAAENRKPVEMEFNRAVPGGLATLGEDGLLLEAQRPPMENAIPVADKGAKGGVATLDDNGKVPVEQLPVYFIPDNTATLDKAGKLAENQRPDYAIGQVEGLTEALKGKQDKLTGNVGQLISIGESGAEATIYPSQQNLLDNWYFIKPINQRGISGVFNTVGSYFIDRWVLISGSVEITNGGLKLNGTIEQRFENAFGDNLTATALSTTGFVDAEYDNDSKKLQITANGDTIVAAKLELGPVQTLAHQDEDGSWVLSDPLPNYSLELKKCQRYYYRDQRFWNVYPLFFYTFFIGNIIFPVRMRIAPTVTILDNGKIHNMGSGLYTDITITPLREGITESWIGWFAFTGSRPTTDLFGRLSFTASADL